MVLQNCVCFGDSAFASKKPFYFILYIFFKAKIPTQPPGGRGGHLYILGEKPQNGEMERKLLQ